MRPVQSDIIGCDDTYYHHCGLDMASGCVSCQSIRMRQVFLSSSSSSSSIQRSSFRSTREAICLSACFLGLFDLMWFSGSVVNSFGELGFFFFPGC